MFCVLGLMKLKTPCKDPKIQPPPKKKKKGLGVALGAPCLEFGID